MVSLKTKLANHLLCFQVVLWDSNVKAQHVQNANHIFNAVHSCMRQFGSSLNHNGMSLFVATVPQDVELYHGTSNPEAVNGTEWLAFEPEHALLFAWAQLGPPPDEGPTPPRHGMTGDAQLNNPLLRYVEDQGHTYCDQNAALVQRENKHELWADKSLFRDIQKKPMIEDEAHGYLHTYRTKRELRLLYVDGQSAAKSRNGTLDVQDMVLLHHNPPINEYPPSSEAQHLPALKDKEPRHRGSGPLGEFERAQGLCKLTHEEWNDRIDGILRMEGGFEIILCDFEKHLDVVSISATRRNCSRPGPPIPPGRDDSGEIFNYYHAIAARYDGIGGGRVSINFDRFVSLFAFDSAIYFDNAGKPRVNNDTDVLKPVQRAIKEMILSENPAGGMHWQAKADMLIARYADRIEYLASGDIKDLKTFQAEIDRALQPFIDYSSRNSTSEIHRCSKQFMPSEAPFNSIAGAAILNVNSVLCTTLSKALEVDSLSHGLSMIRSLKSWLEWTTWKRCRGCSYDEVCFLPIWPVGSAEDFVQPKCRSEISSGRGGYWGDMRKAPRHVAELEKETRAI